MSKVTISLTDNCDEKVVIIWQNVHYFTTWGKNCSLIVFSKGHLVKVTESLAQIEQAIEQAAQNE